MISKNELAKKIQYTNILANATRQEIIEHCNTAAEFNFNAVMIQPCWVLLAKELLKGTSVRVATAICYPLGGETTKMKVEMVKYIVDLDADEFDFQPNIGFLKSDMHDQFSDEISAIVRQAGERPVKLMSEFGFLNEDERITCIRLGEKAGVAYIKNSSGVGPGGSAATVDDIRFIKSHLFGTAKIKASGQIKTYEQAISLIKAGADLLGTSSGPSIINQQNVDAVDY